MFPISKLAIFIITILCLHNIVIISASVNSLETKKNIFTENVERGYISLVRSIIKDIINTSNDLDHYFEITMMKLAEKEKYNNINDIEEYILSNIQMPRNLVPDCEQSDIKISYGYDVDYEITKEQLLNNVHVKKYNWIQYMELVINVLFNPLTDVDPYLFNYVIIQNYKQNLICLQNINSDMDNGYSLIVKFAHLKIGILGKITSNIHLKHKKLGQDYFSKITESKLENNDQPEDIVQYFIPFIPLIVIVFGIIVTYCK